ncbi:hypothetical protein [Corynebacterium propinquum]|uniref:hypothetical protein n=1 Tax=Corynebacterium propinquum TaxID=43769 RepID=UPI00345E2C9C
MYAAFVTDVYSRRIVGWALSDSMRTSVLAAASTQSSDCECEGNDRSYLSFGSRLTVRQRCLQRARCPTRDHCFHRNGWRLV